MGEGPFGGAFSKQSDSLWYRKGVNLEIGAELDPGKGRKGLGLVLHPWKLSLLRLVQLVCLLRQLLAELAQVLQFLRGLFLLDLDLLQHLGVARLRLLQLCHDLLELLNRRILESQPLLRELLCRRDAEVLQSDRRRSQPDLVGLVKHQHVPFLVHWSALSSIECDLARWIIEQMGGWRATPSPPSHLG